MQVANIKMDKTICSICEKTFSASSFAKHLKKVHSLPMKNDSNGNFEKEEGRSRSHLTKVLLVSLKIMFDRHER